jgi:hypothetical protein
VKLPSVVSFSRRPHEIACSAPIGENPSGLEGHEQFLFGLDGVQTLIGHGPGSVTGS